MSAQQVVPAMPESRDVIAIPAEPKLLSPPSPGSTSASESGKRGVARRQDLRVLKRGVLAILLLLLIGVCYLAQEVLIPILLALLISLLLSPPVTLLQKIGIPRALASFLILLACVGGFGFGVSRLATPARDWIANAPTTVQTIEQRFRSLREPLRQAQEASQKLETLTQASTATPTVVASQPSLLSSMATSTPRALGSIAVVLILVYFFLSSGNNFLRRMVEVAPNLHEKKVVVSIARDVQEEMSRYLVMVSLINIALGLATALAMKLLGVPNPLLWGVVATVMNFAPYVGPAATGLALTVAGFTTFDTLGHAFAVPGAFFVLAFFEGQLITPTIIGRRLSLDPTVVFVWLLLWGWLWGIVGILLAGPLLACFRIVCQHVESLHGVCVLIGDGSSPEAGKRQA